MSVNVVAAGNAGAFISGIDLSQPSDEDIGVVKNALGQYGVVFFREQSVSPDAHIRLAEKFGTININRFFQPVEQYPQIAQVLKEPTQQKNIGEKWHTDHSYDQIPALGSILVARLLPSSGGDTIFVNMFAAWQALDSNTKTQISQLTASHSSRHVFGEQAYNNDHRDDLAGRLSNTAAATQDAVHPLVISHPFSGKPALYVNPQFTVKINELPEAEGQQLLKRLYQHCLNEAFMHHFDWRDGSVAFWDIRATWHRALNDYAGERRLMHRITVEGCELAAAV